MICEKCGGEMEERCAATNPPGTTWFCPLCGNVADLMRIDFPQENLVIRGISRRCSICEGLDFSDAALEINHDWICPECVGVLREIVMERRRVVHGL